MLSKRKKLAQMVAPKISPTLFDDGAVGLRIVAAMSADCIDSGQKPIKVAKSDPIPIRARGPALVMGSAAAKIKAEVVETEDEDGDVELSESYTCVISRVGGGAARKWVYLDDDGVAADGICCKFEMSSGLFFESPTPAVGLIPGDFLSCCYLCRKKLHGLDIFMYRGDKAFCSADCRYQQILSDEHKEKCWTKAKEPCESPLSPYLDPLLYDAGVAAA